jgi:glucosamine-6-phosphate deaminase
VYNSSEAESDKLAELHYGRARVRIYASPSALADAAAEHTARSIAAAVAAHGRARIVVATGNSQIAFIGALTQRQDVAWNRVEVFHLDEYIGLPPSHLSSFHYWIEQRLESKVHPARVSYMRGDAPDLEAETARYTALLNEAPLDIGFVGFGENGHIAFNDPHAADFEDSAAVKRVVPDEASRRQQSGEGHFATAAGVPREALTITCSALFRIREWICCVPDARKAEAVRNALEGPLTTACPASIVRNHPNATVYLDPDSSALLAAARSLRE